MTRSGRDSIRTMLVCGALLALSLSLAWPVRGDDLSRLVTVTKSERSLTDRRTMLVTTTAAITITNSSTQEIAVPLHAVFDISSTEVQVLEALPPGGGNPYGRYYTDLSSRVSGGSLKPGGSVSFTARLVSKSAVRYSYSVLIYGTLPAANQAPVADAGTDRTVTLPYGQSTIPVSLDGSGSRDPDGAITAYSWSGPPQPAATVNPVVVLPEGTFTFTLTVTDNQNAQSQPASVTITVVREVVRSPLITISTIPPFRTATGAATPLNINVTASSPDGRRVALSAGPFVTNAVFTSTPGLQAAGTFSMKPEYGQQGSYLVTFTARDSYGLSAAQTVQVDVARTNRPPLLSMPATASGDEGQLLTIPVVASDPDGDILTLAAAGLPPNAVYVPSGSVISFTPGFDQAGSYPVTVTASDGQRAVARQVTITVNDVPNGGGGGDTALTLTVDPVESPTFLTTQKITGTVNSEGPAAPARKSSLITGMSPASGGQGEKLTVLLTGDTGSYATHFATGSSAASFGAGVTVTSLTITSPTTATAAITVDPIAAEGPRSVSVTTGSETAVSVNAFTVVRGKARITGRVLDAATGLPLSGATAILQGSPFSALTNSDGSLVLADVPSGQSTLVVNAANHELVVKAVTLQAGSTTDVGELKSKSTVFDPAAPPTQSMVSILGRGIGETTGTLKPDEARKVIRDTLLMIAGNEVGVMDEYGNQLNPAARNGVGYVNLTSDGIRILADQMMRGDSIELQELLFAFNFGLQWSQGSPLTLDAWLELLQQQVNAAWADPNNPDSAYAIVMFNKGRSLMPDPPQLSPFTMLNPVQAHVFSTSLLTYAFTRNETGWGSPSKFWRNAFATRTNYVLAAYNAAHLSYLSYMMGVATFPTITRAATACRLAVDIIGMLGVTSLDKYVPEPPRLRNIETVTNINGREGGRVHFTRSTDEVGSSRFLYTLWRFNPANDDRQLVSTVLASELGNSREGVLEDTSPPVGTFFYAMTVSRLFSPFNTIPLGDLENDQPYWLSTQHDLPDPVAVFRTTRRLTSDYSNPLSVTIGDPSARTKIDYVKVAPDKTIYYLTDARQTIYKILDTSDKLGFPIAHVDTGFKIPGAMGLAIDLAGNLFSENSASDSQFGGRIFKFRYPAGVREFTGSINYFSQMLMFAQPTSAGPMAMAPDDSLFIMDQLSREVKQVAVNASYDPYRRVGQPIVRIPDEAIGQAFDMELDTAGNIYLLYFGLQAPPTAGITLGPSSYPEVPKSPTDAKNKYVPVRTDGLITEYGISQVRVNVLVLDANSQPLPATEVRFESGQGTFSTPSGITDSQGRISATLETLFTDHTKPQTEVVVRATVPFLGQTFTRSIPVINNLQAIFDRFFREIPKGQTIQDGTYYTSGQGLELLSRLGPLAPYAVAKFSILFFVSQMGPGNVNNTAQLLGGRSNLGESTCGGFQGKVLDLLNNIRKTEPYLLNGLEYGPTQVMGAVHHNVVLWDKRAPNNYLDGLFLDPWINQTPELFDVNTVRAQWFGFTPKPDRSTYANMYPLTGSTYYPDFQKEAKPPVIPTPVAGVVIGPQNPAYIEIIDPHGNHLGIDADGQQHEDISSAGLYAARGLTRVSMTESGVHDLKIKAGADSQLYITAYYGDTQEVHYELTLGKDRIATLPVDYQNRGQKITLDNGQQYDPVSTLYSAVIKGVSPAKATKGATLDISLTGENTHFVDGISQGIPATGITINSLVVTSPTTAVANVSIAADATQGHYAITVMTGTEFTTPLATLEVTAP